MHISQEAELGCVVAPAFEPPVGAPVGELVGALVGALVSALLNAKVVLEPEPEPEPEPKPEPETDPEPGTTTCQLHRLGADDSTPHHQSISAAMHSPVLDPKIHTLPS